MFKNKFGKNLNVVSALDLAIDTELKNLTSLMPKKVLEKTKQYDNFTLENNEIFASQETQEGNVTLFFRLKNADINFCLSVKNEDLESLLKSRCKIIMDVATIIASHKNISTKHSTTFLKDDNKFEIIKDTCFYDRNLNQQIKEPIRKRKSISIEKFKSLIDNVTLNKD